LLKQHEIAHSNVRKFQKQQKARHATKFTKIIRYQPGPFKVHKCLDKRAYVLHNQFGQSLKEVVHADQLKPYLSRLEPLKITNFTMDNQQVALLKLDLIMVGLYPIQPIEYPYLPNETWYEAMIKVYNATQRASQQKQRINALVYAFYMGKLIESSVTPRTKWMEFVRQKFILNEKFIYNGVTRVYQLFLTNPDQIYYTQEITFRKIAHLNNRQFKEMCEFKESSKRNFEI
ncbi:13032_t:CDS:2, partial [Dentiscutata erythropus]